MCFLVFLLCLIWQVVEVHSQAIPYVSFGLSIYPNKSFVDLTLVMNSSDNVQCHTDLSTCCTSSQGVHRGDWYFNETKLGLKGSGDSVYEARGAQRVDLLHRKNASLPSGIYRCDIPTVAVHDDSDLSVRETIYVGLYPPNGGVIKLSGGVALTDLNGDNPQFIFTCISTAGPFATVTWTRNNVTVTQETETVLNNPVTAQYTHTLTVTGRLPGIYTCTVANNKPSNDSAHITVQVTSLPSDVMAVQDGPTSIRVSWSPSSDATGYRINYNSFGGSGNVTVSGGSTYEYRVTGLKNGEFYTISIVATSQYFPSNVLTVAGYIGLVPARPEIILVYPTIIAISIAKGSIVTRLEVVWLRHTVGCSQVKENTTITSGFTSYDIMGLEEDSNYTFTVTAYNSAGSSEVSNTIPLMTLEAAPSAPPTSVRASDVTSSSITVQWGPVDCIHRNGDITGYSVQYGSEAVSVSGDSSGGMYVISGLMPSTASFIRVAAVNSAGTGPFAILHQLTAVVAPVLSAGTTTATSISLSWTSAGSDAVSYEVMWETNDIGGCSGRSDIDSTTITDGSTSYDIMGLEEDSSYTITVTASNSDGSSAVSNTVTAMSLEAAPSASPTSVRVYEVTSSSITVQWRPVNCIHRNGDITGYSVRFGSDAISLSRTSRIYVISGLIPSTAYTIQVVAKNNVGTGPYSAAMNQLTTVAAPVLSAGTITATSVYLSWTRAGSESLSYDVMWSGGCFSGGDVTITDGSTTYNIMGLDEGSRYIITVTAYNSAGSSAVSNSVTVMTLEAAPSAPPTIVSVSEVTSSSITVQWGPVDCIHRNGDVIHYSVQYVRVEGETTNQIVAGRQTIFHYGLATSAIYTVSVAAVNSAGTGIYSDEIVLGTGLLTLSTLSLFNTYVTIKWTLIVNITATDYTISYSNTDCPTNIYNDITGSSPSQTMYTLTGLEEGTDYSVTVTAALNDGMIAVKTITFTTLTSEVAPSAPPTSLSAHNVTSSSITVRWGPVDCIHRNGDIRGYSVQYEELGSGGRKNIFVSGDGVTETTISNLIPFTWYRVYIAAVNDAGIGVSKYIMIKTLSTVEVPVLSAGTMRASSISLSWTSAGSGAVSYEVMWQTHDIGGCFGGNDIDSTTITDGSASYDIMGLEEDSSYTITVTASNSAGSSAVSNTVTATTLEGAPSASSTSVRVSEVTSFSITVQWRPVDCIHRNGDITGYSVRYVETGSAVGGETFQSVRRRQATLSGLTPSTEYTVSVAAFNVIDIGIYSDEVVQQTADVLSVSVVSLSTTSLTISWSLANGLTATDYTISYSNTDCPLDIYDGITDVSSSPTIYILTGLEEGSDYSITVTVTLNDGETGNDSLNATTMTIAPSSPPTAVNISEVTSTSITVQWGPVNCSSRNGHITGYSVRYGEVGSTEGERTLQMVLNRQATISGLTPSTKYTVSVASVNSVDTGVYSNETVQETGGALSVSALSLSAMSVTISWTLADGLTATNGYSISYSNTDTECFTTSYDDITTSHTVYTLTGLEEGTDYSITVTVSLTDGGTGEDSLTATTMTAASSSPPSSVSISIKNSTTITVQWGPVNCLHHNGDITGYSVRHGDVRSGGTQTVSVSGGSATETTISSLTPSVLYTIEVAAVNSAGTGIYSYPLIAEIPQSPDPTSSSSSRTAAIIGVVVAIIIIGTIVLIMSILIVRARQTQSKVVIKKPDQHDTGESPQDRNRGGHVPTTNNMAYELTTLPQQDNGSHEYELIGESKRSGPKLATLGEYEMPDDVKAHNPHVMPLLKTTPKPPATPTASDDVHT